MKKYFNLLLVILLFLLIGCKKDETTSTEPKVEDNGLTKEINNFMPDSTLKKIKALGITIHTGNKPPTINGIFFATPYVLKATNIPNDFYQPGHQFGDLKIKFSQQDNTKFTINVAEKQGGGTGDGVGAFIVGNSNYFSIFVKLTSTYTSHTYITANVITGEYSNGAITNLHYALVMIDDKGDPNNNLISNGQARLIYDSDGNSPSITESEFNALIMKQSKNNIASNK